MPLSKSKPKSYDVIHHSCDTFTVWLLSQRESTKFLKPQIYSAGVVKFAAEIIQHCVGIAEDVQDLGTATELRRHRMELLLNGFPEGTHSPESTDSAEGA